MKFITKRPKTVELSSAEEKLMYAMQLLGDKTRFKIFKLLMNNQELCVSEIAEQLGVTLSAVSQHFRNFEMVGLVQKERMGQKICYMLKADDALVDELLQMAQRKMVKN